MSVGKAGERHLESLLSGTDGFRLLKSSLASRCGGPGGPFVARWTDCIVSAICICGIRSGRFDILSALFSSGTRCGQISKVLRFVLHASTLKHVGPFSTAPCVTVLEVLSKVICSEELLRLIAFGKFVYIR